MRTHMTSLMKFTKMTTKRILQVVILVLVLSAAAFAQTNLGYNASYMGTGNGCVTGGTCYYIDFTNGSDANDGLAKTIGGGHGPWKRAPGMQGATGNALSHSFAKTDEFILKGGETWTMTS